jgi:hypothetical protein
MDEHDRTCMHVPSYPIIICTQLHAYVSLHFRYVPRPAPALQVDRQVCRAEVRGASGALGWILAFGFVG